MLAAVVVPLGSVDSAAVADLLVPAVPPVPVLQDPELPAPAPQVPVPLVLAQARPGLLLRLWSMPLPQVAVESEVPVHLQGRRSFSAAMARSSPPTARLTFERAPSTR